MDGQKWEGEDYIILGVTSWGVSLPTYKETPFEQVCTCKKHHQKAEEDRSGEFGAWQLASKLSNSVDLGSVGKRFQPSKSVWQPLQAPGAGGWAAGLIGERCSNCTFKLPSDLAEPDLTLES